MPSSRVSVKVIALTPANAASLNSTSPLSPTVASVYTSPTVNDVLNPLNSNAALTAAVYVYVSLDAP